MEVKTLQDIQSTLKANLDMLTQMKVHELHVFGSFARGEQSPQSDIDLLIKFSEPVGYFHFLETQRLLVKILGRKVDLATLPSIRPEYLEQVKKELVRAA